ncbi:MAG: hypothetical protein V4535_05150 [Bacteroidota bacterium]
MRKIILVLLSIVTLVNLVLVIISLTQPASSLYPHRFIIGISLITFGAFLRRHIVLYNKTKKL